MCVWFFSFLFWFCFCQCEPLFHFIIVCNTHLKLASVQVLTELDTCSIVWRSLSVICFVCDLIVGVVAILFCFIIRSFSFTFHFCNCDLSLLEFLRYLLLYSMMVKPSVLCFTVGSVGSSFWVNALLTQSTFELRVDETWSLTAICFKQFFFCISQI